MFLIFKMLSSQICAQVKDNSYFTKIFFELSEMLKLKIEQSNKLKFEYCKQVNTTSTQPKQSQKNVQEQLNQESSSVNHWNYFYNYFFYKLNMDFLRRLFSSIKQPALTKIQVQLSRAPQVKANNQETSRDLPPHSNITTTSSSFNKRSMVNQIQTKFLQVHQLSKEELTTAPDFGTLVGVMGHQKYYQNFSDACYVIKIGQSQQINSIRALRKKSLDSLVVFFNQMRCQFQIEEIILADQRLILVVQQQSQLQLLVSRLEKKIIECFQERTLNQCLQYLCCSVICEDKRCFLEFKESSFFLDYFRNLLKKIEVQFQDDNQFLRLLKLIKFKDYLDFRQLKKSIVVKILSLKSEIQRQVQELKRKEDMKKLGSLLSTCENQDQEQLLPLPIRKNSSMEADIQAQYFKKRMNQKRSIELNKEDQIQSADLFYFIEERDDNESQDQEELPYKNSSKNIIRIQKKKGYTKSQYCSESQKEDELDQQFFNRY